MQCWFWNIHKVNQEYFNKELNNGRLRQGWGYDHKLDLRKIENKISQKIALDDQEQGSWDHCISMLLHIKQGDLIAVKNLPAHKNITLVQVAGEYDFSIDSIGDFGHYLPINIIKTFHKYSKFVPAPLANAINRAQNAIIVTYKHKQAVENLQSVSASDDECNKPEEFKDKVSKWRYSLLPHLKEAFKMNLTSKETERLILEMLKQDGMNVLWTAGPTEKGADLICDVQIGYGLVSKIAIQVKMNWDEHYDTTGIDQLEKAFQEYDIQSGLLVTMADTLSDSVKQRIDQVKQKYNIEVLYGEELYSRLLELIADSNLDIS